MERSKKEYCGALGIEATNFALTIAVVIEILLKDRPRFIVEGTRESYDRTV
jgi:hypothetical protein